MKNSTPKLLVFFFVLCLLTTPRTAAAQDQAGPGEYDLKVITFNVAGLPDMITFKREFAKTKKRFAYIGEHLKGYDIIAIQEAFIPEREIIEKSLKDYYVVHGVDVGTVKILGSGVYTFSRWGVTASHFEKWPHLAGADAMSHKGFVAATVKVSPELTIDVYNLHGQTRYDDLKIENYTHLAEFMKYFSGGSGRPILLIGDFNCRYGDEPCAHVVSSMNMTHAAPDLEGLKVDHIFYNENGSGWSISVQNAALVMTEELDGKRISDHKGLAATLRFTKNAE